MIVRRLLGTAAITAALVAAPTAAFAADSAPIVVGGQTVSAAGCDYTVVQLSYDPSTGAISFTGASIDCP